MGVDGKRSDASRWKNGRRARVCVVGAGAMGGLLAGRLTEVGVELTLVDVGERLDALRADGLTLLERDGRRRTWPDVRAVGDPAEAGPQDLIFLAVKAYDLPQVAPRLAAAMTDDTVLVTLQNGIPWWYFHRQGGDLDGRRLESLDPDGSLARHLDADRVIGCVPYPAAEVLSDGAVRHVEGDKFPVGELDGAVTDRLLAVAGLLEAASFRARLLEDIRSETWLKAWGNLSFNPLSALTGATLGEICRFPDTRRLVGEMMREAQDVAHALGASFRVGIERRIQGAEAVGAHKTSMLQDLEAGRRLETEALVGSVVELGRLTGVPTPSVEAVYAAVRLLERTREPREPSLRAGGGRVTSAPAPRAVS